jgi:hypothetical protein
MLRENFKRWKKRRRGSGGGREREKKRDRENMFENEPYSIINIDIRPRHLSS